MVSGTLCPALDDCNLKRGNGFKNWENGKKSSRTQGLFLLPCLKGHTRKVLIECLRYNCDGAHFRPNKPGWRLWKLFGCQESWFEVWEDEFLGWVEARKSRFKVWNGPEEVLLNADWLDLKGLTRGLSGMVKRPETRDAESWYEAWEIWFEVCQG